MDNLNNDKELLDLIKDKGMSAIYFTGGACGACEVIKTKIEDILKRFPEVKSGEVNAEKHLDLAAKYNVFSVPIFLLYIEGKESIRVGRNLDLLELEASVKRYYEMIF